MRCMQHDVLAGPMRVPQLQGRRSNLSSLESTLELITRVQQSQAAIQVQQVLKPFLQASRSGDDGFGLHHSRL